MPILPNLASLLSLIVIWQGLALSFPSPALPTIPVVLSTVYEEVLSGQLPYHLGVTLARLSISFIVAMTIGTAIGLVLGRSQRLNRVFDLWLIVFLNVPALVTIILCYVWFGLSELSALLAVIINKVPNVIVTIREGSRTLDEDLLEMAKAYRFGFRRTVRHVILPQLLPFLIAAARTGLALIWKIILVVELLGRSSGMGYQLHLFFQMFNVAGILAYTFAFIAIIQLIEASILRPLDAHARRWRR